MGVWLVCKQCGTKEWLAAKRVDLGPCPKCHSARFAEDDNGKPVVLFSELSDPNDLTPSFGVAEIKK